MQFGAGRFLVTMCCAAVLGTAASATPQTSTTRPTTPALPGPVRDPGTPRNLPLLPTGTGVISGTISTGPSGQPTVAARVTVYGRDVPNRSTVTDDQGRFSFEGLPAGRFTINASKPGHVNVTYAFETNARGTIDASGRFIIQDVLPGKYRLSASFPGSLPWLAQEIVVSGQDALDFPLEVKANQNVTGVVVTLTDQQAELSGTIVDDKGQPATEHTLFLYSTDPKYWGPQSRRIRTIRAGSDGYYILRGVPPGDYRLTTVVDPEPELLYQREVLEQLDTTSVRITLGKGEKKVEHVRVRSGG